MIYVFKTSVKNKRQINAIAKELDKIENLKTWNFDLEDCDKIMRIETTKKNMHKICSLLISLNYVCEELE